MRTALIALALGALLAVPTASAHAAAERPIDLENVDHDDVRELLDHFDAEFALVPTPLTEDAGAEDGDDAGDADRTRKRKRRHKRKRGGDDEAGDDEADDDRKRRRGRKGKKGKRRRGGGGGRGR